MWENELQERKSNKGFRWSGPMSFTHERVRSSSQIKRGGTSQEGGFAGWPLEIKMALSWEEKNGQKQTDVVIVPAEIVQANPQGIGPGAALNVDEVLLLRREIDVAKDAIRTIAKSGEDSTFIL